MFTLKMLVTYGKKIPLKSLPGWLSKSHGKLALISLYEFEKILKKYGMYEFCYDL